MTWKALSRGVGVALGLWILFLIFALLILGAPEAPPLIRGAVLQ